MNIKASFNKMINNLRVKTGYNYKNKESLFYRKQLNKILICIIIILVALVLKKIDIKFTNNVIRIVNNTLSYSINIKEDSIKALNFVRNKIKFSEQITSVFNNDSVSEEQTEKYFTPAKGILYQKFGEIQKSKDVTIFHSGIDIIVDEKNIYSISDGLVVEIIQNDTIGQIKIDYGDIQAIYKNIETIETRVGEKVLKGQIIGNMGETVDKSKYLHFEIWENDSTVDPLNYIDVISTNTVSM